MSNRTKLFTEPNKFTKKPSFRIEGKNAIARGYHCYKLSPFSINPLGNSKKVKKYKLLSPVLSELVTGKEVNDLGCANGLHTISCAFNGAARVNAVDIDNNHLRVLREAFEFIGLKNIKIQYYNVQNYDKEADITIALGLIHWVFSCTSLFGSFDKIMEWLKSITRETVLLEWIAPKDANIEMFHHIEYNKDIILEKYNKTNFIKSLEKHFSSFELVGKVTSTREIYKIII